ncbi:MAG: insulinase family protein [Phycisphaerae bacterium]|nr:insulinase family protein [Phycisphaerae bacterium]
MTVKFDKYILNNGMVIVGEPMESVRSAAFGFSIPAGASVLDEGCCGAANIIEDWIFRGAGERDSRQLSDELDGLGLHRSSSIGSSHLSLGAALESTNLEKAVGLYADIILKPKLEDDQFELAKELSIQSITALDDDPRQKVMLILRELFYPQPLGISNIGHMEDIEKLGADKVRDILKNNFNPSGTIFSVAGKYDFDNVVKQLESVFETNEKLAKKEIATKPAVNKYTHLHNEGAQVHIGLMTKTVPPTDKDIYNARAALAVLSGGMSARLFTEVREKRGLCYAIGARYHGLKDTAGIMCYAGTTPEKAQQTLDTIITEFNRLKEGITEEEIQRAKVGLKSSLILSSESTSSRAGSIASDHYLLGRIRSLDEIKEKIEEVSVKSIQNFLEKNIFEDFTIVTIGPKEVKI